jgi:transcriptional regulator with XRE-family HTH domain
MPAEVVPCPASLLTTRYKERLCTFVKLHIPYMSAAIKAANKKENDVAKRSPLPIDVLVGQNIRICRLQKGLSQGELGRRIGVTFQQVQKYEKGANRVGASRLTQIADVLGVPIPTLFDGAPSVGQAPPEQSPRYLLAKPHSLRLLQGFDRIDNDATRLAVLHLVESLMHAPVTRGAAAKREGSRRRA